MDSCKATSQTLVVYPTTGAIQESTTAAGTSPKAATIPSTTAMGAEPATATVASTTATALGTK